MDPMVVAAYAKELDIEKQVNTLNALVNSSVYMSVGGTLTAGKVTRLTSANTVADLPLGQWGVKNPWVSGTTTNNANQTVIGCITMSTGVALLVFTSSSGTYVQLIIDQGSNAGFTVSELQISGGPVGALIPYQQTQVNPMLGVNNVTQKSGTLMKISTTQAILVMTDFGGNLWTVLINLAAGGTTFDATNPTVVLEIDTAVTTNSGANADIDIAWLSESNGTFAVAYVKGTANALSGSVYVVAVDISGTTLTKGTAVAVTFANTANYYVGLVNLEENKVAVACRSGGSSSYIGGQPFIASGTTLTAGTAYASWYSVVIACPPVGIKYQDNIVSWIYNNATGSNTYLLTLYSSVGSNTLTYYTVYTVSGGIANYSQYSLMQVSATQWALFWINTTASQYIYVTSLTFGGAATTPTIAIAGTRTIVGTGNATTQPSGFAAVPFSVNAWTVIWTDNGTNQCNFLKTTCVVLSGTTFTVSNATPGILSKSSSATMSPCAAADISNQYSAVGWRDGKNSPYNIKVTTVQAGEIYSNQSDKAVGICEDAILGRIRLQGMVDISKGTNTLTPVVALYYDRNGVITSVATDEYGVANTAMPAGSLALGAKQVWLKSTVF
jgi:hypothetical protein